MGLYRFEIVRLHESAENDSSYQYNTFYLQGDGSNLENVNLDAAWLFALNHNNSEHYTAIESRVYDAQAPTGDSPLEVNRASMGFGGPLAAPQELAIALHYCAGEVTPRRRGRLYVSDWVLSAIADRPPLALRNYTMNLGAGLATLGGASYTWMQYSRADALYSVVTRYWVYNHWSYLRSRKEPSYQMLVADV